MRQAVHMLKRVAICLRPFGAGLELHPISCGKQENQKRDQTPWCLGHLDRVSGFFAGFRGFRNDRSAPVTPPWAVTGPSLWDLGCVTRPSPILCDLIGSTGGALPATSEPAIGWGHFDDIMRRQQTHRGHWICKRSTTGLIRRQLWIPHNI